ncbi:MAG: hypothetical protein NT007_02925 [Candidatus Kapabacteria bacterium]|nr:hypothetical protein [Candidatus Kapabacteria bacterium]
MLKIENNNVLIPLVLWKELKGDLYFNELIEIIEDRETLFEAKAKTEYFVDLDEYHQERMKRDAL